MEGIEYVGEHLLPGYIGHLLLVISFVSAFFGTIAYFKSNKSEEYSGIAKTFLLTHVFSTIASIGLLFYIVLNLFFEYNYAYKVASETLPFKYIFSAFWQDQEGSFLLWMFWHCILMLVLLFHKSKYKYGVLGTILAIESILAMILLGVVVPFTDITIGVNPFALLRDIMDIPLFANADYVSLIKGQGLNPLLQNYWNVIHPPTLFLGFASAIVPFAFAISALVNRDHFGWLKHATPWILWAAGILGLGLLMGSAWAYEALSFGGYWAWDPVENSSLVPWILQIAALHAYLISSKTKRNIGASYLLTIFSFFLVIYSTFLTRSGVLGDTSVHAFTEMGLGTLLLIFLAASIVPGLVLFFIRKKDFPKIEKEEALSSKEFWMFIGILIMIFSVFLIVFTTSIPVFNKILDAIGGVISYDFTSWHRTAPIEPIAHYNKYQIWIAILVGLLSGVTQWLRYKESNFRQHGKKYLKHLIPSLVISLVLTFIISYVGEFKYVPYRILLFAGLFTMVSNIEFLFFFLSKKKKQYGSVLSHFGFGLMLVGILFSGTKERHITHDAFMQKDLIQGMTEEQNRKNVMLYKNSPLIMENYEITYVNDTLDRHNRYFQLKYRELDENLNAIDSFEINPHIIYTKDFTKVEASNPYSKHFFDKDIYSYISKIPSIDPKTQKIEEDSLDYTLIEMAIGDTIMTGEGKIILEEVYLDPSRSNIRTYPGDIMFEAKIKYQSDLSTNDEWLESNPTIILRGNTISSYPDRMNEIWAKIKWSENLWEQMWELEQSTEYQEVLLKPGESTMIDDVEVHLHSFSKDIPENRIEIEEDDIALTALLSIGNAKIKDTLRSIFLIRDKRPIQLKDYLPRFQMNVKFSSLDPAKGQAKFLISRKKETFKYPMMLAKNVSRKDYIVLQVREFPWINLFWAGTIMMLGGLFYSSSLRRKK